MITKQLISDKLIPIEKNGKTVFLTQEEYDAMVASVDDGCPTSGCHLKEGKKFRVPDFLRGKQIISEIMYS